MSTSDFQLNSNKPLSSQPIPLRPMGCPLASCIPPHAVSSPFWVVLSLILLLIPFGPFRCASSFVPCHSMTFQLKSNQRNNIRTLGRHGDRTEEMRCCGD